MSPNQVNFPLPNLISDCSCHNNVHFILVFDLAGFERASLFITIGAANWSWFSVACFLGIGVYQRKCIDYEFKQGALVE